MPFETVDSPIFCDIKNRNDPPVTKTHRAMATLRDMPKASLESDSQGRSNLPLRKRVRDMKIA